MNIIRNAGHLWFMPALFGLIIAFSISGCNNTNETAELNKKLSEKGLENKRLLKEIDSLKENISKLGKINKREAKDAAQTKRELRNNLGREIDNNTVRVSAVKGTIKIELLKKIFFDSGSAYISRKGRKILAKIAPVLKRSKKRTIYIIGHTDRLPPGPKTKKDYPSNWELSVARATSVIRILQWGHKINPKRLVAAGVAHYRPIPVKKEGVGMAFNRVVEILIVPSYKPFPPTGR